MNGCSQHVSSAFTGLSSIVSKILKVHKISTLIESNKGINESFEGITVAVSPSCGIVRCI